MADAREEHVWTNHALKDHVNLTPYTKDENIEGLLKDIKDKIIKVLDLGCGSGLWRPVFKDMHYVGMDQNEAMLKVAIQHFPTAGLYLSSMNDLNELNDFIRFAYGYFRPHEVFVQYNGRNDLVKLFTDRRNGSIFRPDLVWCSAVLQHNRHIPDKDEIVKNVHDLLLPGSYWMFAESTFSLEADNYHHVFLTYDDNMTDGWSFTRTGWKKFMEDRGFELIGTAKHDYFLFRRV